MPEAIERNEMNNDEEELDDESPRKSKLTEEVDKVHSEVIGSLGSSVKAAKNTFRVNFYVNMIIIFVGILIIVIAIGQSIAQGVDSFSVAFGSLGVANFVAVFLLNPQSRLQENLCRLSQMNVILSNFLFEYDNFLRVTRNISDIKKLKEINREGECIVSFTVKSISELVTSPLKKADVNESE